MMHVENVNLLFVNNSNNRRQKGIDINVSEVDKNGKIKHMPIKVTNRV